MPLSVFHTDSDNGFFLLFPYISRFSRKFSNLFIYL